MDISHSLNHESPNPLGSYEGSKRPFLPSPLPTRDRRRGLSHHSSRPNDGDEDLLIRVGPEELIVRRRYQTLSILNDFLIGFWFLIGSVAFLPALDWARFGAWLFVLGSAQMLVRPLIRLAHRLHLRHVPPGRWEL